MTRTKHPTAIDRFCSIWLDFHGVNEHGRPKENFRKRYAQLGSLLTYSPDAAHLYYTMSRDDKAASLLRLHEIYDGLAKAESMIEGTYREAK